MKFDVLNFDADELKESLELTNQVIFEFTSTDENEWITLHVEDEGDLVNRFNFYLEHWVRGERVSSLSDKPFISNSLPEIVLSLRNFALLI